MIVQLRQVMSVPVQHVSIQSPFVSYMESITHDRKLVIRLYNILLV